LNRFSNSFGLALFKYKKTLQKKRTFLRKYSSYNNDKLLELYELMKIDSGVEKNLLKE